MATSNYALRLPTSLKAEAEKLGAAEGTTLNQLINIAVAEKIAALKTVDYLAARGARANIPRALKILKKAGKKGVIEPGDEAD